MVTAGWRQWSKLDRKSNPKLAGRVFSRTLAENPALRVSHWPELSPDEGFLAEIGNVLQPREFVYQMRVYFGSRSCGQIGDVYGQQTVRSVILLKYKM